MMRVGWSIFDELAEQIPGRTKDQYSLKEKGVNESKAAKDLQPNDIFSMKDGGPRFLFVSRHEWVRGDPDYDMIVVVSREDENGKWLPTSPLELKSDEHVIIWPPEEV